MRVQAGWMIEVLSALKTQVRDCLYNNVRKGNKNKVRGFGTFSCEKFVCFDEMD